MSSFPHMESITLIQGKEIYENLESANCMGLDGKGEVLEMGLVKYRMQGCTRKVFLSTVSDRVSNKGKVNGSRIKVGPYRELTEVM